MAVKNSNPSSGERLLLFVFVILVALVAGRWALSLWSHHR
jgi:hypothetical protein